MFGRRFLRGWLVLLVVSLFVLTLLNLPIARTMIPAASTNVCLPCGGFPGGPLSGIVNTYYPTTSSAAAGSTSINLGTSGGAATPISSGDLLLVIQMQGSVIDTTDTLNYGLIVTDTSGTYEYVTATNAVPLGGGTVTFTPPLAHNYTFQSGSGTQAMQTYQVVRIPQYAGATLGGNLNALPWTTLANQTGGFGGIVSLNICGTLNMNGYNIDVSGAGFRGGAGRKLTASDASYNQIRYLSSANYGGSKGEGTAGTPRYVNVNFTITDTGVEGYPNGSYGRGAPANGGGGGDDGNNPAGIGANNQNSGYSRSILA